MQHAASLSLAMGAIAKGSGRWPLPGHALLGLLASLAACSSGEPHGKAMPTGNGAPAMASLGADAPARDVGASAGTAPAGDAPAPSTTPPGTAPPGNAAPSRTAPGTPPSPSTAPASSEGQAPSAVDVGLLPGSAPGSAAEAAAQTCNTSGAARAATPNLWVVGDSTASLYGSDVYPRMGWAQPLQEYHAPACATVNDRALSGRSSKSFIDEGAWAPVRDALRAGDYVLIQFGHNDEKAEDPLRFTDPASTFGDYLSIYIDDTLAHGATPVLLTPIQRNNWNGTVLRDTHGAYPGAIRELARARGVALVDATALTTEYLERIGPAASNELFLNLDAGQFPNYPNGNVDNTHLREAGAHAIARLILADLAVQGSPLGRLVMNVPVAP